MKKERMSRVGWLFFLFICCSVISCGCTQKETVVSEKEVLNDSDVILEEESEYTILTTEAKESVEVVEETKIEMSDEEWHKPQYMYRVKLPAGIVDLAYSEDESVIYIQTDSSEFYTLDVQSGEVTAADNIGDMEKVFLVNNTFEKKNAAYIEENYQVPEQVEGLGAYAIVADVSQDGHYLLLQGFYGDYVIWDTYTEKELLSFSHYGKDYPTAKFINNQCIFLSTSELGGENVFFSFLEHIGISCEEIFGYCMLEIGKNSVVIYKSDGSLVIYSLELSEDDSAIVNEPNILTNPFASGLWTETEDMIEAISPDEQYLVIRENVDAMEWKYWVSDARSGEQLFCMQFPTKDVIAVAVKDENCAALVNRAQMYYEFNPKNGEVYKSGLLDMPSKTELRTAQLVVDFENNLASIIHKTSNATYSGGLYSTESFEQLMDYGETYKYMKADLVLEKVYYYEGFADEHLVITIQKD